MSDATTDAAGTPPPAPTLPIPFQGFHELHAQPYLLYATSFLYDDDVAENLVDEVFVELADRWDHVVQPPNPAAYACAYLRHVVEAECDRRDEHLALIERVAFCYAMREEGELVLRGIDESVTDLETGITLGAAVMQLTGAKLDVVLLRYLNKLSVAETSPAGLAPAPPGFSGYLRHTAWFIQYLPDDDNPHRPNPALREAIDSRPTFRDDMCGAFRLPTDAIAHQLHELAN